MRQLFDFWMAFLLVIGVFFFIITGDFWVLLLTVGGVGAAWLISHWAEEQYYIRRNKKNMQ